MARLIQNEIKRVLADEILFGKLQNGGKVEVDENEGQLVFSIQYASCRLRRERSKPNLATNMQADSSAP